MFHCTSTGVPISGEVNVAVAIFVLPLNSALNPFLYTLNILKERHNALSRHKLERKLEKRLMAEQIAEWIHNGDLDRKSLNMLQ